MAMIRRLSLVFLTMAAVSSLLRPTTAETYFVGDELGWLVPPAGPIVYASWAYLYDFTVGDVLVFNFTTGQQDVAVVTEEAFRTCNSTNPISLKTTGPANFTLTTTGKYFFIGTMEQHCPLGQKLAIIMTAPAPGPSASPAPYSAPTPMTSPAGPRGPVTYTVGGVLGWIVHPAGPLAYAAWAYGKTFMVGDTLVFNFINGTQDVAWVTKDVYYSCNTNSTTLYVWPTSPAKIVLNATGEYYFTSTYPNHCASGQQLAINVTSTTSNTTATPPSISAEAPSISSNPSTAGGPSPPPATGSAPARLDFPGSFVTLLSIAMALAVL